MITKLIKNDSTLSLFVSMIRIIRTKYIFFIILFAAALLRLWKLGNIPPHLTPDEAALGYNAYSILKTGRDEYAELLPIIFRSFGDFKPGLYVYLTVPFVAILGLTEFAIRLPSAIAGVFAIWFIFLIINHFKNLQLTTNNLQLELIAAFLLAINPWHIHFSRGAWEANISLTLTLAGIYFFLKALRISRFLIHTCVFFALTLLTYQGAKLSTSIVVIVLLLVFWKEFWERFSKRSGTVFASLMIGLLIISPILFSFARGETGRLEVFSVFSYPRKPEDVQTIINQGDERLGSLSYYAFHSEALNFARGVFGRWFNHFSGKFLFFEGDYQNPRHSAPNHGMLLLLDLILLPAGLFALLKHKSKFTNFVLLWLILSPLPAALSRDQVHSVRALNMVIPLIVISSTGLVSLIKVFQRRGVNTNPPDGWNRFTPYVLYTFLALIFFANYIYFLDAYFVHLPKHNSKLWEYGYKQIVETVTPIQNKYKEIKIQQSFAQPYIYFLFYQKHDPAKYQKQAKLVESEYKGDVGYVEHLDNICFCPIDWPVNKQEHGNLIVADPIRIPDDELVKSYDAINLIKEIKYLDGNTAFRVVELK